MKRLSVGSLALLVAACGLVTGGDGIVRERLIATIEFYGDPIRIELPATVRAGVAFQVKVRTYGGGCIDQGDTEVRVTGMTARVTPYDLEVTRLPPDYACTSDLRVYEHVAEVRFATPGTGTVIVTGLRKPENEVISVTRTVDVL